MFAFRFASLFLLSTGPLGLSLLHRFLCPSMSSTRSSLVHTASGFSPASPSFGIPPSPAPSKFAPTSFAPAFAALCWFAGTFGPLDGTFFCHSSSPFLPAIEASVSKIGGGMMEKTS
ncbi:hypothetical protein C8F04DRAFT_633199 [Mycena alexandri]|uniref:Secreted protein n=1 Tax=Mycena alexandri TaxID=1745969 RepID=A0AAD6SV25_9AGAR|nr:hypothetical protein C8F04DRAFT_633199 [Mycena alexandri]